jgi:hypothetical protein
VRPMLVGGVLWGFLARVPLVDVDNTFVNSTTRDRRLRQNS